MNKKTMIMMSFLTFCFLFGMSNVEAQTTRTKDVANATYVKKEIKKSTTNKISEKGTREKPNARAAAKVRSQTKIAEIRAARKAQRATRNVKEAASNNSNTNRPGIKDMSKSERKQYAKNKKAN